MDSDKIEKILIKLLEKFNKNPNYVPTEEEKNAFQILIWDDPWVESSEESEEEIIVENKKD